MQLILISGLSGSGKSIALKVLEDAGCYCVDNLPAALLPQLVAQLRSEGYTRAAVAVDMRGGAGIAVLPKLVGDLRAAQVDLRLVFLDASDEVLIQRFSETRRSHPLANPNTTLAEAITRERVALEPVAVLGHRIDSSNLRPGALRSFIKEFAELRPNVGGLTLLFESFGYKHGLPLDADLVFDVRCLPNPHYDPVLRPLTGCDVPVVEFLEAQPEVRRMAEDIRSFVATWLPSFVRDNRSYLTVAIGCTGGQHRSVYFAEWLAAQFRNQPQILAVENVLVRHRGLAA